ncbi:unnamed protein product, partial [Oppiella nova]
YIFAWCIPIVLIPIPFIATSPAGKCAYVVLVMSFYWFTEAVPITVTALLPIVLFPLLGVLSSDLTAKAYVNGTVMIFLGSLIAAAAVEKSLLHKRIALKVLLVTGTSPKRLLFGFMFTTAFLSMWISNLAATALMIPIINAAMDQIKQHTEAVPITVTALLPIVLFPLLGVLSSDLTAKAYVNGTVMIFLGSLIAAAAVEKSLLHKRIALKVLLVTGTSPKRLLFGFMFTTAFLSMWIR